MKPSDDAAPGTPPVRLRDQPELVDRVADFLLIEDIETHGVAEVARKILDALEAAAADAAAYAAAGKGRGAMSRQALTRGG